MSHGLTVPKLVKSRGLGTLNVGLSYETDSEEQNPELAGEKVFKHFPFDEEP
jgi:hypothetical protein